jgi:prepilin-type N-terminal cleavage/methylation domain-containing protein
MRSANKGFTLVELIVVIAIIAILAAVSIVGYNQFINNARQSRANTELAVIQRQVEANFYVDPQLVTIPTSLRATLAFDPVAGEFSFEDDIQEWVLVADGTQYYNVDEGEVWVSTAQVFALDDSVDGYVDDEAARLDLTDVDGQIVFQIDTLTLWQQDAGPVWTEGDVLPNTEPQPSFEDKASPALADSEALIEQAILDSLDESGLGSATLTVEIDGTVITVTYTPANSGDVSATWTLTLG